jgi:HEAT repeat protein
MITAAAGGAEVPLDEAGQRLKAATKVLRQRKASNKVLVESIDALTEAYRAPPAKAAKKEIAKFRKAALARYLAALHVKGRPTEDKANPREPVQVHAARMLRYLEPGASATIYRALDRGLCKERDYVPSHRLWEAVCESLLVLDFKTAYPFLIDRLMTADTDEYSTRQTRAALISMAAAKLPDSKTRQVGIKRMLAIYQHFPFHVEDDYDYVAGFREVPRAYKRTLGRNGDYWGDIRPLVIRMLRRLSAHPVTGELALDVDSGLEAETLQRFKVWNGKHKNRPIERWTKEPGEALPRTTLRYVRPFARGFFLRYTMPWPEVWPLRAPAPKDKGQDASQAKRDNLRKTVLPPILKEGLKDPAPEVRGMAAVLAGHLAMKDAGKLLLGVLNKDPDENVREAAALGLLLLADQELRDDWRVRARDQAENPQVRAIALLALGVLGDTVFIRGQLANDARTWSASKETHRELRATAVAALGLCGGAGDAPRFLGFLTSKNQAPGVFGCAAAALARHGTPAEADALLARLKQYRGRSPDPARTAAYAHALTGALKPSDRKRIRSAAQVFLRNKGMFGGHRAEMALAIGRVGGDTAFDVLRRGYEGCKKDGGDRVAELGFFLLALGRTGHPKAAPIATEALKDLTFEFDAGAAALALGELGALRNAPAIRDRLSKSKDEFVPHGIEALGRLRDAAAIQEIRDRINTEPRDRALGAGVIALARIRGNVAGKELLTFWERCGERRDYDALAHAFGIAGPDGTEKDLQQIATDAMNRTPTERAFALASLGYMARADEPTLARLRDACFFYATPRTVLRLARFGLSFPLATTDE